ncbi:hypothetical protein QMK19_28010 [Streptomyces sp. H10-C2]|uniref:hypothetical protein n=1 Tax=unclassified Streptomyces TaxID=2593676 RepID=UPI0024BA73B5|nr:MULTISPECIES: hypothetical protein [unclassified Streptomyces]MDJ0343951.1 hypothetical protein [Streptomyces sp. PH10-H1]MDJ0373392.1 hypothetical protein [Streptomyces sp. H10-C2]
MPRVLPALPGKPVPPAAQSDAFRAFARELATGGTPWTLQMAHFVSDQFDELAEHWDSTQASGRDEPVRDALARGGPLPHGPCLELGSGTGIYL